MLGQECLGSIRYAVSHFSRTLKLVVVLARANCGAVTEAVDVYLEPSQYIDMATGYSLRCIEGQILVAVRLAALGLESVYGLDVTKRPGCRAAMVQLAVVLNAAWSAYRLREEFRRNFPDVQEVFGAYDLVSGYVRLPLSLTAEVTDEEKGLVVLPKNAEGFRQPAIRISEGDLIGSLISSTVRGI